MGRQDWYRGTTWSPADEAAFFAKLNRVRSLGSKSQHLRIQALYLEQAGLFDAALQLLDKFLAEIVAPTQLAQVHNQRGSCLRGLGRTDEALAEYRDAFQAQRRQPNSMTLAYLEFGELVLALGRDDLHAEVLSVFREFGGMELTPGLQYRGAVVRAFLHEFEGNVTAARMQAATALAAAARTETIFQHHRHLGLVVEVDPEVRAQLERLASP